MVFSSTVLTWKEEVSVTGPTLKLGDLAYLAGDDPARVAVLQTISMGEAPGPGQTRILTGDILWARLSAAGVNPQSEGWATPGGVIVTTLSQTVSRELIEEKVTEALSGNISYPKEDVTLIAKGRLNDMQIPVGAYDIMVKFPRGIRFVGPTQVVAEILMDKKPVKSVQLVYDVRVSVKAYAVKNSVAAHQFLSDQDVTVEKRTLSSLPSRAIKDATLLKSYWTRRQLSPGTILTEDMLDIPPVVKRNSQVTIIIDYKGISLTACGLALQDGRPGDVIRVQNVESKRIIMAKAQQNGMVVPLGL
jgi:flagella basal body P-ring formation protein FlgA